MSEHVPVLLDRVLGLLAPAVEGRPATVVDATVGLGGHAEALLSTYPKLTLVGLDRDPAAISASRDRLARYERRLHLVHTVYDRLPDVLAELGLPRVDGVVFDLGVSSLQLDRDDRGFSYARDAPLDMRMNPDDELTAQRVVNEYPQQRLAQLLRSYGEERFAARIAAAIVRDRPIESSARLADLVRDAIPAATRRTGGHPAKRTFQALRIEVNHELDALAAALPAAIAALAVHGRMAVLSYHSLEDRMVKRAFAAGATSRAPVDIPVERPEDRPTLRLLTRGAERPPAAEVAVNPRAASARLRGVERIGEEAA